MQPATGVAIHVGSARKDVASSHHVDVLTDVLQRSRARGAAFSHSTARGEWGVRFPEAAQLAIHGILSGEAYAWTDRPDAGRRVIAGDVVLIRGPSPHHMGHAPAADRVPF
jgi:hypothetical protein